MFGPLLMGDFYQCQYYQNCDDKGHHDTDVHDVFVDSYKSLNKFIIELKFLILSILTSVVPFWLEFEN